MGLFKNNIFATAFKELIGPYADSFNSEIIIDPSRHTTPNGEANWMFDTSGGDFRYFKYSGVNSAVYAYEKCPPVAAIINRKTQTFINGKTWILNTDNKVSQSPAAAKLRKLMAQPNPLQNWRSFEAQMYTYFQTFGFSIILPIVPYGFEKYNAKALWNIPANWVDTKATEEEFTRTGGVSLKSLVINFNGAKIVIDIKELIIIKDITPSFTSITFPASKISVCDMYINNIIGALESRNVLINFRGAQGILTQEPNRGQYVTQALTPEQKLDLQRDFKKYGLRKNQFQVILTTASLKWQSIGSPAKDLMLMEEVEESTKGICANLNFPPYIFGLADTTFNNMNEAKKGLYQDATIPDAENIYEQLTAWFGLIENNLRLDKDYSHIPVLQEDRLSKSQARLANNQARDVEWRNGMITLDEWRISNDEDPMPASDGRGKLYFPEYVALYGDPKGSSKTQDNGQEQDGNESGTGQAA